MKKPSDLKPGMNLTNDDLYDYFKVGNSGGMRKSNTHNCLVIICDHSKSLYDDKWDNDNILHYTGMGQKGPQSFEFSQNKTVHNSHSNGVTLYLFERFDGRKPYTFHGECKLAGKEYIDQQFDREKTIRDVCIFPLKLKDSLPVPFSEEDKKKSSEAKERKAKRFTNDELTGLEMKKGQKKKKTANQNIERHSRDKLVVEYALRRADGDCQLCDLPAPFKKRDKSPYLEVHHVIWLSQGGDDEWSNVIALCPNCHRKMHIVKNKADIEILKIKALIPLSQY